MKDDKPGRGSLRPLLMRLHFYAGLFVAPFILTAALSGTLYALAPQLEKVAYHDQLYTDLRGPQLPIAQQIASARSVEPKAMLAAVRPAPEPGQTTRVLFMEDGLGEGQKQAVFVDPVSGDVRGKLVTYGSSGAMPLRAWIDELHRDLHLGQPGLVYSELAASWLWVIALAGLLLWWTGKHRPRLRPSRTGGPRQRSRSWHAVIGTWALLGMLMLSATGLTWSTYAGANIGDLRAQLGWETPPLANNFSDHAGHGGHRQMDHTQMAANDAPGIGPDRALRVAASTGIKGEVELVPPQPGKGYIVRNTTVSWPARVDSIDINAKTGKVDELVRFDDWPFAAKLARWGIQLHMGQLFGVVNQVALVCLGASITTMVVLGYRMWWLRRPTRSDRLFARPIPRGAWRKAPLAAVVTLAVVSVGVGWFIPLLGLSLLGFLVVDAVVGSVRRRRGPTASGPADTHESTPRSDLAASSGRTGQG